MRKLIPIFLLALASCSRQDSASNLIQETANDPYGIAGTWRQTEQFRDPGDGGGEWKPVSGSQATVVAFTPNGGVLASGPGPLAQYNRYSIVSKNEMHLFNAHSDSAVVFFSVEGRRLQLNYTARETMMDRFARED